MRPIRALLILCVPLFTCAGAVPAFAADTPEVEPNGTKAEATVVAAMAPGDTISGTSMGTSVTAGNSAVASADTWDITTTSAPAHGIYRYRLSITASNPGTMTGTIRGLSQTAGVINAGTDATAQTTQISASGTLPSRTVQWYANETPSRIYFRITGSGTSSPYTATLARDPVTPNLVPSAVSASPVLVSTQGQTTANTEIWLYDSAFTAIFDAGNESFAGVTQARLERPLAAGTYIAAIATSSMANNMASPADDQLRTGTVLDFPNAISTSATTAAPLDCDFQIGNPCNGVLQSVTNQTSELFEITFWQFTTTGTMLPDPIVFSAGSAAPGNVGQGTSTTLSVTATGGTPTSVTADLLAFGLTATEAFTDPDLDNIWTYTLNVPLLQTPAAYSINVVGTGGPCAAATRTISLSVTPVNNACTNAIPIVVGGSYSGTTLGAVGAGGSASTCNTLTGTNPGVWYVFTETSPTGRRLRAHLCDPVTNFDAKMLAYTGSCGTFTCAGATDTGFGCPVQMESMVNPTGTTHTYIPNVFDWSPTAGIQCTTPGTTYYITVQNFVAANGGNFVLHLDDEGENCEGTAPAHDLCTAARPFTVFPTWDMVYRDSSAINPDVDCNDPANTGARGGVWYTYAPSQPGNFYHTASPDQTATVSPNNTVLTIYSAAPDCSNLTAVACIDDIEGYALTAPHVFIAPVAHLNAGTTYYFLVSQYDATSVSTISYFGFNFIADPGACCTAGACAITNGALACTSGGGTFQGYASTCSPDPCAAPTGVCCRGATCNASIAQASCTGSGTAGAFFATSSGTCNAAPTSNTPCCFADYNKTGGVTVQDIFDFLGDWFAGNPFANTGSNGGPGPLTVQNIFAFLTAWFSGGC